jgi:hypothetical protein
VLLRVEHLVGNATFLELSGEFLGLLNRHRADEYRLPGFVLLGEVVDARRKLGVFGLVDQVAVVETGERTVRGHRNHVEPVGAHEFRRFGFGGAGHTRETFVEPVVVLQGDGGEGLVLLLDGHTFLRFHGLVETIGPAAAIEDTTSELVDDLHLAVLDDVILVDLVELLGS